LIESKIQRKRYIVSYNYGRRWKNQWNLELHNPTTSKTQIFESVKKELYKITSEIKKNSPNVKNRPADHSHRCKNDSQYHLKPSGKN